MIYATVTVRLTPAIMFEECGQGGGRKGFTLPQCEAVIDYFEQVAEDQDRDVRVHLGDIASECYVYDSLADALDSYGSDEITSLDELASHVHVMAVMDDGSIIVNGG